jgi:hypothetical protein
MLLFESEFLHRFLIPFSPREQSEEHGLKAHDGDGSKCPKLAINAQTLQIEKKTMPGTLLWCRKYTGFLPRR